MANTQTRKTPAEARAEAEEARLAADADAAQARAKADEEAAAAKDKAALNEQKAVAGGELVVLTTAFMARTNKDDKTETYRYSQGEVFKPVSGLHNVDRLVALGVLGKVGGKAPVRPATALGLAQAAAKFHQEDSPVLDLNAQPFEVAAPPAEDD